MTWPQAAHLSNGMTDLWDAKLNLRILDWDIHQTLRDPLELFQLNFFHPARFVLAFSENLYGVALFGFPLVALGASPVVVYNSLLLLGMFLSALAAWALARWVTGDPLASLVAGIVYAFVPWRLSQLPHLQFQWGPFLCLLLLFLLRYLHSGRRRDLALFAVSFAWNVLANLHFALFAGLLVAVTLAVEAIGGGTGSAGRIGRVLAAAAFATAVCLPWLLPYRAAVEMYGMRRGIREMELYSGRLTDFLSAGERNRLYGPWTRRWDAPEGFFFPGILPLVLAGTAIARLPGLRRRPGAAPAASARGRSTAIRVLDAAIVMSAVAAAAALGRPNLRIGPVGLGDAGRALVVATALVVVRLGVAFPKRSRFRDLGDWLSHRLADRRAMLFVVVGGLGILVALGGHTPYYRFLFQSFGAVFRAIRSPARGIVLLHLALGVLAAWGLSSLTRAHSRARRVAWVGAAIAMLGIEYRAFPLKLDPIDAPPPVYRWLKTAALPGAVVEWPLDPLQDLDYIFCQTVHGKPILNGYSGFFPKAYDQLQETLGRRPISDSVWGQMAGLGASVLVYHPRAADPIRRVEYARAVRRGLANGRLEVLVSFPHGADRDIVFRLTSAPRFDPRLQAGSDSEAARILAQTDAEIAPPFGVIDAPVEGAEVSSGGWGYGWALDDSGVASVEVAADGGPAAPVLGGGRRPDLEKAYPDYPGAGSAGFGFSLPRLSPGPHTLTVTLIARDGGRTELVRTIRVR